MDLFRAVEKRRSIREFKPTPVATEDLRRMLEAGRLAPSGGNLQPWYFIAVGHPKTKKALVRAFNEKKVKKILRILENFEVVALLPKGVRDEDPPQRPRKTFTEIFFKESFGKPLELK